MFVVLSSNRKCYIYLNFRSVFFRKRTFEVDKTNLLKLSWVPLFDAIFIFGIIRVFKRTDNAENRSYFNLTGFGKNVDKLRNVRDGYTL